jgi:hypothetical protein
MQPAICSVLGKNTGRLVVVLTLLLIPACMLLAPHTGHAQNVPPVGKPVIVGIFCPKCKGYIDAPNGKGPSSCPHCGYSFAQPSKPKPAATTIPKLKGVNPFGDSLFHDVPIIPDDGKLKTRHFDKDGLAAKAEAWGKEMKQVDAESRQKQDAQAQAFEHDKQELLKGQGNGPAHRQLKNIYADGNAWDGDSSVVDLRGKTNLTPRLPGTGAPGSPTSGASSEYAEIRRVIEQGKYAHMSPEELDAIGRQYPDNAEIQQSIARLKAQTKSTAALGDLSDRAGQKREVMESEYDQAGRKGREAASKVLSLTTPVPDGLVSAAYGDKTWAEWAGVDATSYGIQEGYQSGAEKGFEKFVEYKKWQTPVAGALGADLNFNGMKVPVGGVGGVIKGVSAVPDLIELHQSATEGADHYVAAEELNAELKASGGTVSAVNKWSTMRNQSLDTSADLSRLLQEANKGTNAP